MISGEGYPPLKRVLPNPERERVVEKAFVAAA
jgi:hypothetical protein